MAVPDDFPGFDLYYDYRIDILRRRNRVTATLGARQLAASERTLLVDEQSHGLVFYFPEGDVDFSALAALPDHQTRCPWKGEARYWRAVDGTDPIAWAYPAPRPEVAQIAAHVAFYQDQVTVALGSAPYLPIVIGKAS